MRPQTTAETHHDHSSCRLPGLRIRGRFDNPAAARTPATVQADYRYPDGHRWSRCEHRSRIGQRLPKKRRCFDPTISSGTLQIFQPALGRVTAGSRAVGRDHGVTGSTAFGICLDCIRVHSPIHGERCREEKCNVARLKLSAKPNPRPSRGNSAGYRHHPRPVRRIRKDGPTKAHTNARSQTPDACA